MEAIKLSAGGLVLDQPTERDIPLITEYCQDPLFERFLTIPWPYETQHAEYFVNQHVPDGWASGDEVTWAIRDGGMLLGVIGLRRPTAMIGFWLGAPHRGRGHMTAALTAVVDWSFASGYADPVRWECMVGNLASASVAYKAGFTFTGVGDGVIPARDGTRTRSWLGELHSRDDRAPKDGWEPLQR